MIVHGTVSASRNNIVDMERDHDLYDGNSDVNEVRKFEQKIFWTKKIEKTVFCDEGFFFNPLFSLY